MPRHKFPQEEGSHSDPLAGKEAYRHLRAHRRWCGSLVGLCRPLGKWLTALPVWHELHYLQMTTEKLSKAYFPTLFPQVVVAISGRFRRRAGTARRPTGRSGRVRPPQFNRHDCRMTARPGKCPVPRPRATKNTYDDGR